MAARRCRPPAATPGRRAAFQTAPRSNRAPGPRSWDPARSEARPLETQPAPPSTQQRAWHRPRRAQSHEHHRDADGRDEWAAHRRRRLGHQPQGARRPQAVRRPLSAPRQSAGGAATPRRHRRRSRPPTPETAPPSRSTSSAAPAAHKRHQQRAHEREPDFDFPAEIRFRVRHGSVSLKSAPRCRPRASNFPKSGRMAGKKCGGRRILRKIANENNRTTGNAQSGGAESGSRSAPQSASRSPTIFSQLRRWPNRRIETMIAGAGCPRRLPFVRDPRTRRNF